jgi:hypothetical protein
MKTEEVKRVADIEPYNAGGKKPKCPVHQYGLDGKYIRTFSSQYEAGKQTGTDSASISLCISGKSKSAGGFQWRKA